MKIVHLSKFYKPYSGGLESVVESIAEANHGETFVLAVDGTGLPLEEDINGVSVVRSRENLSVASTPISLGYILNTLKYSSNSIFHVHLPNPLANISIFIAWLMRRDTSRIIVHWHSDIVKQKRLLKIYKPFQDWILRRCKIIVVTSQNYLDHSEQLRSYHDKCLVIPIGIDSIKNKVNSGLVLNIKSKYQNKKIVFSLGRHIYYKGFEYLINAAKNVDNAVFLIGGKGPDTDKYQSKIDELGLQTKVFLIGRIEDKDLPSYYAAADIFCFPSIEKSEAFGVVQLEAMSLGIPVISTEIKGSGVPWVNKHGWSGMVCKPKCSNELSHSLNAVLENDELRSSLSKGALERFENNFTREKMSLKFNQLYKDVRKL
ncbi:MAG TPA: glycosyl transferase family 1 [Proteus sp.]|nr:glycosyl transferase family 1 [Proteus sp. (in: enterobacteria)]